MDTKPMNTDWEKETIEIWKLDLERLLWSYHENGRPDGKTGLIGNPKTIQEFVENLISQSTQKAVLGKIEARINELKSLHKQITDKHELHRADFNRNPDSISAKERVISDENSGYICEVWGRLNELEDLLASLTLPTEEKK